MPLSRRALLLLSGAAGAATFGLLWNHRRPLPNPALNGTGPIVDLALFGPDGKLLGVVQVRKLQHSDAEWHSLLTAEQFALTRRKATEFAFANRYWNFKKSGLYRCVCCGNALFRSGQKFDSGTGWPSFWAPIASQNVATAMDRMLPAERTEVLCRKCDAHLGHVFEDGPPPTGQRYCINSGALEFCKFSSGDREPFFSPFAATVS